MAEWFIKESGGDLVVFEMGLRHGHRFGQAFFNALTREDQDRLRGSSHDPFFGDVGVIDAIDFLTQK